jgi:hypothetical protein
MGDIMARLEGSQGSLGFGAAERGVGVSSGEGGSGGGGGGDGGPGCT